MPISTIASEQGPALGSAIHAAVAAGAYADVLEGGAAMGRVNRGAYTPNTAAADAYDALYADYEILHDYFGRGTNDVMHRLAALRRAGFRTAPTGPETTSPIGPDERTSKTDRGELAGRS
jgi:L-ribulokinase